MHWSNLPSRCAKPNIAFHHAVIAPFESRIGNANAPRARFIRRGVACISIQCNPAKDRLRESSSPEAGCRLSVLVKNSDAPRIRRGGLRGRVNSSKRRTIHAYSTEQNNRLLPSIIVESQRSPTRFTRPQSVRLIITAIAILKFVKWKKCALNLKEKSQVQQRDRPDIDRRISEVEWVNELCNSDFQRRKINPVTDKRPT